MADLNTAVCNKCGAIKRTSNHWFRIKVEPGRIVLTDFTSMVDRTYDVCGAGCLQKMVGELISQGVLNTTV